MATLGRYSPESMRSILRRVKSATARHTQRREARRLGLEAAMRVEGQTTLEELNALRDAAAQVRHDHVIVELGSYRARSCIALAVGALAGRCRRVYAIDPHIAYTGPYGGRYGPFDQQAAYSNIAANQLGHVIFVVSLPSTHAARAWNETNVGLLWIDGDHRYESVHDDVRAWWPHIVAGGMVAFHDMGYPGVALAVDELRRRGAIAPVLSVEQLLLCRKQMSHLT